MIKRVWYKSGSCKVERVDYGEEVKVGDVGVVSFYIGIDIVLTTRVTQVFNLTDSQIVYYDY